MDDGRAEHPTLHPKGLHHSVHGMRIRTQELYECWLKKSLMVKVVQRHRHAEDPGRRIGKPFEGTDRRIRERAYKLDKKCNVEQDDCK
jgi:hypothetical protein